MTDAFELNHKLNQNIYSKYIQFGVLHHRLHTRDKLEKINIKEDATYPKYGSLERIGHLNMTGCQKMCIQHFFKRWSKKAAYFSSDKITPDECPVLLSGTHNTFCLDILFY